MTAEQLLDWTNANCVKLRIVGPITKRLACGDVGIGGMAEVDEITAAAAAAARAIQVNDRS